LSAVIAFVTVLIMYSQAYQYLWEAKIVNVMPGYWYGIVSLMAAVAWFFSKGKLRSKNDHNVVIHRSNQKALLIWAAVFAGTAAFSFLFSDHQAPQLRALKTVLILLAMMCVFMAVFRGPREVRAGRVAMLCVVLFSVVLNFVDLLGMYSLSNADGRAAGFYVNPNISGMHLVLGMILSVSVLPRRWRLVYCLFVGLGVAVTFSRASVLMWLVSGVGLTQLHIFDTDRRLLNSLWLGVVVLALLFQFRENIVGAFGLEEYLSDEARQRLHLDLRTDESVQGRIAVAERSWNLFKRSWMAGHGLGAHNLPGTLVEPHNMFLLIGMEMGVLGLSVYLAFYWVLWRMNSGIARVFAIALFIAALFSHNVVEYSAAVWLSYALLAGITNAPPPATGQRTRFVRHGVSPWAPRLPQRAGMR